MKVSNNFIIGIDEAGRGPLAGPVSVGVFGANKKMEKWLLQNIFPRRQKVGAPTETSGENFIRDSKKLSPQKREEFYKKFCALRKENKVFFAVAHVSNKIIDKKGISYAINYAIKNLLVNTKCSSFAKLRRDKSASSMIKLDGSLKAPPEFKNQKTIIKGDEKEVLIACASIVAKVSRDRLMSRLGSKYPLYALEVHKGYGTALHRSIIEKHGLSPLHRQSFCKHLTS